MPSTRRSISEPCSPSSIYFAAELRRLAVGVLEGEPADRRLAAGVVLGSIPAGLVGLAFQHVIEERLRSVTVVAVSTILWAVVLWWADRRAAREPRGRPARGRRRAGARRGPRAAPALIPGTSRSGITLSAGLFAGLDRPTAARFAFLLGLPITLAAGLLQARTLVVAPPAGEGPGVILLGIVTSFVAGLAAIRFLVAYLQRRTLLVFVIYRIVLGVLLLALARG